MSQKEHTVCDIGEYYVRVGSGIKLMLYHLPAPLQSALFLHEVFGVLPPPLPDYV